MPRPKIPNRDVGTMPIPRVPVWNKGHCSSCECDCRGKLDELRCAFDELTRILAQWTYNVSTRFSQINRAFAALGLAGEYSQPGGLVLPATLSLALGSYGLSSTALSLGSGGVVNINGSEVLSGSALTFSGTQVVGTRKTGWSTATGAATRTTFATSTVTLEELAERVKALIDDLHASAGHGIIGT